MGHHLGDEGTGGNAYRSDQRLAEVQQARKKSAAEVLASHGLSPDQATADAVYGDLVPDAPYLRDEVTDAMERNGVL